MRKFVAVIGLSAVALLGACGGDDDNTAENASAGSDTTEVTTASGGAGAGGFGKYCDARGGLAAPNPSGGGDMKSTFQAAEAAMDSAVANAPSEIKADVETVVNAARPFYKFLRDNNYDYMKLAQDESKQKELADLSEKFNEEKVRAASDRIEAWAKTHCS